MLDPRRRRGPKPDNLPLQALRAVLLLLFALWIGQGLATAPGDDGPLDYSPAGLAVVAIVLALPMAIVLVAPLVPRRRHRGPNRPVSPDVWQAPGGRPRIAVTDGDAGLLVVDLDGRATALPGPTLGGIRHALHMDAHDPAASRTDLVTAEGHVLVTLPSWWWASDQEAERAQALLGRIGLPALLRPGVSAGRRPRRGVNPARDEIAFITSFFAVPLCFVSAASGAPFAAGIAAGAAALATGLLVHRLRRSR